MGSRRVGHDWATSLSLLHTGEGNGNPSRVPAWRIPGTGEPGGLPSMGRAESATLQLPSSSSRARHTPLNYIPWGQYQAGFCCSVAKSSPTQNPWTFCPGSSARLLLFMDFSGKNTWEWVAISFSGRSSHPGKESESPALAGPTGKLHLVDT